MSDMIEYILFSRELIPYLSIHELQRVGLCCWKLYDMLDSTFWEYCLRTMIGSETRHCKIQFQVTGSHLHRVYMGQRNRFKSEMIPCTRQYNGTRRVKACISHIPFPVPVAPKRSFYRYLLCGYTPKMGQGFMYMSDHDSLGYTDNLFYYEVTLTNEPVQWDGDDITPCFAIGISSKHDYLRVGHATDMLMGWSDRSFGYHSDDGNVFHNSVRAYDFLPFGVGDVIGCGIDHDDECVFFTKNGVSFFHIPLRFQHEEYHPTITYDHDDFGYTVNFGDKPFCYQF